MQAYWFVIPDIHTDIYLTTFLLPCSMNMPMNQNGLAIIDGLKLLVATFVGMIHEGVIPVREVVQQN